jgi:energy-coupling factor transporter ATP-binding protein EcfA2
MITKLIVKNFKRLGDVEIELSNAVVFIGPNNSGKTTALQSLALWDIGWRRWAEKRDRSKPSERAGVTINRRDLYAIPVPSTNLLWKDTHTTTGSRTEGKLKTEKVYIQLLAEGIYNDEPWRCGLSLYHANAESFYCKLTDPENGLVPEGARSHHVVYLPPMSGLAEREHRKEPGEISVLIGEGRTAEVLRNLVWQLFSKEDKEPWKKMVDHVRALFSVELMEPVYIKERSEFKLSYREESGVELDISSSGRGCQQVLLLLSYLLTNPGAVLLLDEPDAHLEILRQRDVYNLITEIAETTGSQIIAASHSEVVLQEAAEKDVVVAFVGKPHRIDTRSKSQVKKALESIHMADYYMAEQKGWMLYLEGSTDLAILKQLAEKLNHPVSNILADRVPVMYLGTNLPKDARDHFQGLREAKKELVGYALFDRLDRNLDDGSKLQERMWKRREIENYITTPESLRNFILQDTDPSNLFGAHERFRRQEVFEPVLAEIEKAIRTLGNDPYGPDIKVTDEFLDPLMKLFFERLGTPQRIYKRDYHGLARAVDAKDLDPEVTTVLDEILAVAQQARPNE